MAEVLGFDTTHYVPVVKWKAGEYRALKRISAADKATFTPLIEPIPVPIDFESKTPKATLDKHLAKVPKQIADHWGMSPLFIDVGLLGDGAKMSDGRHPVTFLCEETRKLGASPVPVVSVHTKKTFRTAAAGAAAKMQVKRVCLRHTLDEVLSKTFAADLAQLLLDVKSTPSQADFIIDLENVQANRVTTIEAALGAALPKLPHLKDWASLTVIGTGFPFNLAGMKPGLHSRPRLEWTLWKGLAGLPRQPTFGDYTIAHPEMAEGLDPKKMRVSASIRYAVDDEWLVFRGRNVKDHSYAEYLVVAKQAFAHAKYCGPAFSWGDQYVHDCAKGRDGPGQHETWRRAGVNHHITFVLRQLASHFASSAPGGPGIATGSV